MGVACVHCGDWIHGRFDGPQLDPFRQQMRDAANALDIIKEQVAQAQAGLGPPISQLAVEEAINAYEQAKTRMQREDQRFQETWRGKLGVSRPAVEE